MMERSRGLALAVIAVLATSAGCVALREYQCDAMTKLRAHSAYNSTACPPSCASVARHYERGWKQGYYDVAKGGEGCAPPLPPEQYFSFKYQCPKGEAAVHTWYRGYQDGAHAAFASGVQQFNYVPSPCVNGAGPQDMPMDANEPVSEPIPAPPATTMLSPSARPEVAPLSPVQTAVLPPAAEVTVNVEVRPAPRSEQIAVPAEPRLRDNPLRPRAVKLFETAQAVR